MVFAVAYFASDAKPLQHKILSEHIFYIRIYLYCYDIYILYRQIKILFYTNFANTALTKAPDTVLTEFLGKLHRLIDGYARRYTVILLYFIDSKAENSKLYLANAGNVPVLGHFGKLLIRCPVRTPWM